MSAALGSYRRIDVIGRPAILAQIQKRKEDKLMRLQSQDDDKIQVTIRTAKRDAEEMIDELDDKGKKTGKKIENERFGKIVYETVFTQDIFDAKPAEVKEAVLRGLNAAAKK